MKSTLPHNSKSQFGGDILLAGTFLQVVGSGSFGGAAERLRISQAAVSMRI